MSSIVKAVSDLLASVVEVIWSFFTTALHLVENTLQFVVQFFSGIVNLMVDFVKGLVDLAGGIASFVVGNIIMLALVSAAVFGFLQYQRSQGKTVRVGNQKLN